MKSCATFPNPIAKGSLPSWERGLKFKSAGSTGRSSVVAPLVGAWIEIFFDVNIVVFDLVAPLVGAWIEIWNQYRIFYDPNMSLPSWERGLKSQVLLNGIQTT